MIKEGNTEYWDDVERFVRNQLVANQFRDVERLRIDDPATAKGLRGAFESYAAPNTLIASRDSGIEGCCINGGVRGFFLAYQNAVQESKDATQINLLVSHATSSVRVVSYLPREGRLDLYPKSSKPLLIRLPGWLQAKDVTIDSSVGIKLAAETDGHFLRVSGAKQGERIILHFKQREESAESVVAKERFDVSWRGDTVTRLTPGGKPYAIYAMDLASDNLLPVQLQDDLYKKPNLSW
ncbi:MAG: hypothetical protein WCA10_16515 [Terracidiphilus sp.]